MHVVEFGLPVRVVVMGGKSYSSYGREEPSSRLCGASDCTILKLKADRVPLPLNGQR